MCRYLVKIYASGAQPSGTLLRSLTMTPPFGFGASAVPGQRLVISNVGRQPGIRRRRRMAWQGKVRTELRGFPGYREWNGSASPGSPRRHEPNCWAGQQADAAGHTFPLFCTVRFVRILSGCPVRLGHHVASPKVWQDRDGLPAPGNLHAGHPPANSLACMSPEGLGKGTLLKFSFCNG